MLLTMEHNCKEECRLFPSPERIDKVEESMENLEQVVRERNHAYWRLEVGEEPPMSKPATQLDPNDPLALIRERAAAVIQAAGPGSREALKFVRLLKEKERNILRKQKRYHSSFSVNALAGVQNSSISITLGFMNARRWLF